jgi:hypothetical protein
MLPLPLDESINTMHIPLSFGSKTNDHFPHSSRSSEFLNERISYLFLYFECLSEWEGGREDELEVYEERGAGGEDADGGDGDKG